MRWLVVALCAAGCGAPSSRPANASSNASSNANANANPLPFIEDDYPRALAEARARHRPLFVDLWAPWCHTCRFVREFVLGDRALTKEASRFVWLAVDVDKDANAPFVTRFPVHSIPTFLVIDPATEKVAVTRSAGLDLPQLLALLGEGERALGQSAGGAAEAAFHDGERLMGDGRAQDAVAAFTRGLAAGGPDWARHRAAVEALALALDQSGDARGCAELAEKETRAGAKDAWWANLVTAGLDCLEGAEAAGWRAPFVTTLLARAQEGLTVEPLGVDDRSSLYEVMAALLPEGEKRALAQRWMAFLDGEAARVTTPAARAVYDPHRLLAAIALGDPARAVPMLEASERALPDDYNGPARLALAYEAMGRYDDALAACQRALGKVYGPRRLRVEETRADIYRKKGDLAAARRTLEEAIVFGRALPHSPRADSAVARLVRVLETLR